LSITTKLTGSPYKERLGSMAAGDMAYAMGPIGHFILEERYPALMVAGGVGISPFRGMIRYAADRGLAKRIALLYSARTPDEFVFRRELDEIAEAWGNPDIVYTVTRPHDARAHWSGRTGRIDDALVRETATKLGDPTYYICGTPGMVDEMIDLLRRKLGVPRERLRVETFMGY
jgi:ferredoxin-NADP reductase